MLVTAPNQASMLWRFPNGLGLIAERHRRSHGVMEDSKGYSRGLWELSVVEFKRRSYRKVCNSVLGPDTIAASLDSIEEWLSKVEKLPGYVSAPAGKGKQAALRAEYEELAIGLEVMEHEIEDAPVKVARAKACAEVLKEAMMGIKKEWVAEGFKEEIL